MKTVVPFDQLSETRLNATRVVATLESLQRVRIQVPEMLVGAGAVLTPGRVA